MPNDENIYTIVEKIANKLRGPYRPPQYRKVILPMTVLRRFDCVLERNKDKILNKYKNLKVKGLKGEVLEKALENFSRVISQQPLYNISKYTFKKLLDDQDHIAKNMITYINGFSPRMRNIFENFKFEDEIEKLNKANRLFLITKEFNDIDLHPEVISNIQMGNIFEELIRRYNEKANEEAGDHFTPREVIKMMTHILYSNEEDIYKKGIIKTIYDPACGTGGMLSVSEEYIKSQNSKAYLELFGQEYNDESYAICTSDLLIKDEEVDNIIFGDTLGDGETTDGHPDKKFDYMLANPPFGVEWKPQKDTVEREYEDLGFDGRFGPGLPRISDGSLLFLLHMISKMNEPPEKGGSGSKIAIVFNGSPLFSGDAGSGESNIRRWIIENDWLDCIVALPDQLFYNTGIYTYIWFVTNKKPKERRGKVQIIDATRHYKKMTKSKGNKRNEITEEQIDDVTKLYGNFKHDEKRNVEVDGQVEKRSCSKIFDNKEFGYIKVTVERPLRLNYQASEERIQRLREEPAFILLAESKKKKDKKEIEKEEEAGRILQANLIYALGKMNKETIYRNREKFIEELDKILKENGIKVDSLLKKAILNALSEKDPEAEICYDSKGNPDPDPELRDNENIDLPAGIKLPLPLDYDNKTGLDELIKLVKKQCEDYMKKEVLPHVPDAWIDYSKTKIGYEISVNRYFYVYKPPRDIEEIEKDLYEIESDITELIKIQKCM